MHETSETDAKRHIWQRLPKKWRLLGCGVAILLIAGGGVLAWRPWDVDNGHIIPHSMRSQISDFTPYEPELLPNSLKVQKSSVTFNNDVLIFRITNPLGKAMTITEQNSPPQLSGRSYDSFGYEKVDGVDGTAYITRVKTRTFATLFATGQNNKPTMILVNTNDVFSDGDIKDLLRSFRVAQ